MSDSTRENITQPLRSSQLQAILVSGADARDFLQGQLSADIDTLTPERALLASCNSSQGRVQAVLWLLELNDGIALVLPASMTDMTLARLRKYVLRSKVKIEPAADRLPVAVVDGRVSIVPAENSTVEQATRDSDWRLESIRAGLPQVYPQTHEAFVAQMLNLDLLGGISFDKGCYTGQEIIARTHYRGAIKRRMFRFKATCPAPQPGTRILAGEQHAGDVVDAASTEDGCELLAVISLAQLEGNLQVEGSHNGTLERLELPYKVE